MDGVTFTAELRVADNGSWRFVSLPADLSAEIRSGTDPSRPGFGSVRVEATLAGFTWQTSVFPDAGRGVYVLPVKAAARRSAGVEAGDEVTVGLRVIDGP